MKPKEYYLTEKGKDFDWEDPKYVEEEKSIMEVLETGRKSINSISQAVSQKLERNINWRKIESYLHLLKREGFVKQYEVKR